MHDAVEVIVAKRDGAELTDSRTGASGSRGRSRSTHA